MQTNDWWVKAYQEKYYVFLSLALELSEYDYQRAQDLVQDAALKLILWQEGGGVIENWNHLCVLFYKCIKQVHLNYWKRAAIRYRIEEDLYVVNATEEEINFKGDFYPYIHTIMKRFEERLTPMEKIVLKAVFFENLTGSEIRDKYSINPQSISHIKRNALDKLKKCATALELSTQRKTKIAKLYSEGYEWYQIAYLMREGKEGQYYKEFYFRYIPRPQKQIV